MSKIIDIRSAIRGGDRPGTQLDLFASVLHSYTAENGGRLDNASLYANVVRNTGIDPDELQRKVPVGKNQQKHNLLARALRWQQQSLKHAGILERVDGERGVWQLTSPASKDLNQIQPGISVVGFSTNLGVAILGSCDSVFASCDTPITLAIMSPPFPLAKPRAYGNPTEAEFVDWICQKLEPIVKNLADGASLCINVSNDVFLPGMPARSCYAERLLLALNDRFGLYKMDTWIWNNPSKPPGPVRYASIDRTQLCVGYEPIYWVTNNPAKVKSNNRRVLQAHSERHLKLMRDGGEKRSIENSDGAYIIRPGSYGGLTEGKIPKNVLTFGHACQDQRNYKRAARALGLPVHGAPMPLALVKFIIEFLSDEGDLIVDPFGGSFTSAKAAELLGRRWLSTEIMLEYVLGGALRFRDALGFIQHIQRMAA